jgi:DNA-binding SARP family transcriptional activator
MTARRAALGAGCLALAKAAVLAVGVPLALARLWNLAPVPGRFFYRSAAASVAAGAHLVVLAVAVVWLVATASLLRDVWGALRRHETLDVSSWSARWAGAIAGLILLAAAGSSLVAPGSSLTTPNSAVTAPASQVLRSRPAPASQVPRAARATVTVASRECLADVALRATGCVDDWPLLARLNLGHQQADGARMLDPARLRPGWQLDLPRGAPRSTSTADRRGGAAPAPDRPSARQLAELGLLGLGVVTTCALARRIRHLRRTASSGRRPGERRVAAAPPVGEARVALEPFADAPLIDWIDLANRLLWRLVRDLEVPALDVRLVRAGPDGIELLLASPCPVAPWPFFARRDGHWWVLDPAVEPAELRDDVAGARRLFPSLVPLGDDDDASYLLAVGPGRRLGISGADEIVDRTLDAIVTSLRTVPWAEELGIELVGIDPPPADERCFQLSSSTTSALEHLAAENDLAGGSRLGGRWRREPLVVVGRPAAGPDCERVLASASSLAGIVAAGKQGTEQLLVEDDRAVLLPYGIELRAVTPATGQLALLDGLLREARRPPTIVPIRPGIATDHARLTALPVAGMFEVQLLRADPALVGPLHEVAPRDLPRLVELVAYLALHDGTAPVETIADALFPRSAPATRRVRADETARAARAALGRGPGDRALLVRSHDGLLLDPAVTCDLTRARRAFASARFIEPAAAEVLLSDALALVEGTPLSAVVAGYSWFGAEGYDELLAAEIVDAAHHLVALALAADRSDLATWAIARGRLAGPDSEILARDLMTTAAAENDAAAVRGAFSELERALERLGGGEPSLETRALLATLDPAP